MRIFLLILAIAGLTSCGHSVRAKSENELHSLFAKYILQKHPVLFRGTQLVFIISRSECSPCIETVEQCLKAEYGCGKTAITFDNSRLIIPSDVHKIDGEARVIARYGLLNGDGNVCVFKRGTLSDVIPVSVENSEKLIKKIRSSI